MSFSEVKHLKEVYTAHFGGVKAVALTDIEFSVDRGEYIAIARESGSGKTTLLDILAALDKPTSGDIVLDGKDMSKVPDSRMAVYRRDNLGFVFQDSNLLDTFSIKNNILLPMVLAKEDYHEIEERLAFLVKQSKAEDLLEKFPYGISGGRRQRAAVVRALITKPWLLLTDKPTEAPGPRAADGLLRIFRAVNHSGQTVFMVTHSTRTTSHAGRVFFIRGGIILHQLYRKTCTNEEMYQKISDTLMALATRKRGEERDEQHA